MTEIKVYKSPWRALKMLGLCLPFVLIGYLMVTKDGASQQVHIFGWCALVFFSLGIPVALYQLLDRRPQIIINELGIYDRSTHLECINWEIIFDAYLIDIHGQQFISLVVDEAFKPSKRKGKGRLHPVAAKISEGIGAQEINIHLGAVKIDAERLTRFIKAMCAAETTQKQEVLKQLPELV